MKVLVSAYACSPYHGSEPGVGWGFVKALAYGHELCVIVEEQEFKKDIAQYLVEHPDLARRIRFEFVPRVRWRFLERLWPPSYYWTYRLWQRDAFVLAKRLHGEVGFDLIHQLTMVGFREPGYLWKLGVPFVWGPVGGMGYFPWRFLHKVGLYGALYYVIYNLYNGVQLILHRRARHAAAKARGGLIAATPENQTGTERRWGIASVLLSEVGLPYGSAVQMPSSRVDGEPLRIIWTGLHTPGKALNLGLEALTKLGKDVSWELNILGKGPRTRAWMHQTRTLGIDNRCHFRGWLARDQALKAMSSAHVLLITSLRDLTSTVTIEALALGLPIICLDHCGFAHVVNETCGIKVSLTTPSKTVQGLAAAINRLAVDELFRQRLARGAVTRAEEFSWENKIVRLNRIYASRVADPVRET